MNGYSRITMHANLGKVGVVTDTAATQSVQVQINTLETRDNVPVLYAYGFASNPHPGADIAVICVEGDRSKAFAVGTGDQRYRMKGLASGEIAIYDDLGRSVYFTRAGIVINGGGSGMTISNVGTLTISGDVSIAG